MNKAISILIACLLVSPAALANKKKFKVWNLNVTYYIALSDCAAMSSSACQTIINNLKQEITETERLFSAKPALKIKPTFKYIKSKDGKQLENVKFDSQHKLNKYMDKNFDNVATSKTTGHLTVLIVKSLSIKGKAIGGIASFPHRIAPFSRKRGLISVYTALNSACPTKIRYVTPHELGHSLALKHTFASYTGGARCNKDYKKGEKGKGSSKKFDANGNPVSINLMDYKSTYTVGSKTCYLAYYLNSCQAERAAKQRRMYMTNDGKTNYRRLTGRL